MCFTHSCHGDKNSADIYKLIRLSLGCNDNQAVKWLEEKLGVESAVQVRDKSAFIKALRRPKKRVSRIFPEGYLRRYTSESDVECSYYEQRGYDKATLKYFDIHYCFNKHNKYFNRALIPIHDCNANLVGISGRWMGDFKKDGVDKFIHTAGMVRSTLLYNWHRALKYFDCGYVILTESPGAVWGLHEIGRFNVVAALGGNLTDEQVKIIGSCSKINTTVLCFDPDEAGRKFTRRAASMLHNKTNVEIIDLTEDSDLDNIDADQFLSNYAARKNFIP